MTSIFSRLSDGQPIRTYAPGQLVYLQGTTADAFYYLVSGSVKSLMNSEAGGERLLTVYAPGSLMGEASFFDRCPRVSSAMALSKSQIVTIDRARLQLTFARHPELALPMLEYLARTVRLLSAHVDDLTFRPAGQRIARYLCSLCSDTAPLVCTQEEIGYAVGTSRITVSRVLRALSHGGILATGYRTLTILDLPALQLLAENGLAAAQ